MDGWTSSRAGKEERYAWLGNWHGVRSVRCSDQWSRQDDGAQRKAVPGHMAASCSTCAAADCTTLHVRTYSRSTCALRSQAFGYLTHFGVSVHVWIPSSLFIMFCRGVRSVRWSRLCPSVPRRLLISVAHVSGALLAAAPCPRAGPNDRALRMRHGIRGIGAPRATVEKRLHRGY